MKICNNCKISKTLKNFCKKTTSKDGHYHTCRACKSIIDKNYRERNKDILQKKSLEYSRKHIKRRCKNEKLRRANRTVEQINVDKIKKQKYNKNAPESVKQRKRIYNKKYFASVKGKKVTALSIKKRRAQKVSSEDGTITQETLDNLMITQNYKCKYCNTDLTLQAKGDVHLDHVIPLSKGGIHAITNVVWSCAHCNKTKSDKIIV